MFLSDGRGGRRHHAWLARRELRLNHLGRRELADIAALLDLQRGVMDIEAVRQLLADAVQKTMRATDVVEGLGKQGIGPLEGGPDDLKRFMAAELDRWSDVASAAGLKS